MSFRNNRDTVISNLVKQACGFLAFLVVPHMLSVENYGQVTYVATLLGFIGIADLGMSFVYSRSMPGLYHRERVEEIGLWKRNVLRFQVSSGVVFACVISALYFFKYGDVINTGLLLIYPPLAMLSAFCIADYVAQGNFSASRDFNIVTALARLLVIPGAFLAGIDGWFTGQSAAAVVILFKSDLKRKLAEIWESGFGIDRQFIISHIPEALALGLIGTLSIQLLSIARVFAAFFYGDAVIAQYGLANAAYQILSALVIAAYVPQTVKTYRMLEQDQKAAMDYVFRSVMVSFPVIALMSLCAAVTAPYFFGSFFPQYGVQAVILVPIVLSLMSYPALVVMGAVLIGGKKSHAYLVVVLSCFAVGLLVCRSLSEHIGTHGAAYAQLAVLPMYALVLIATVFFYFRRYIENRWRVWFAVISNLVGPAGYYWWLSGVMK